VHLCTQVNCSRHIINKTCNSAPRNSAPRRTLMSSPTSSVRSSSSSRAAGQGCPMPKHTDLTLYFCFTFPCRYAPAPKQNQYPPDNEWTAIQTACNELMLVSIFYLVILWRRRNRILRQDFAAMWLAAVLQLLNWSWGKRVARKSSTEMFDSARYPNWKTDFWKNWLSYSIPPTL
jgi:hypothetical protein